MQKRMLSLLVLCLLLVGLASKCRGQFGMDANVRITIPSNGLSCLPDSNNFIVGHPSLGVPSDNGLFWVFLDPYHFNDRVYATPTNVTLGEMFTITFEQAGVDTFTNQPARFNIDVTSRNVTYQVQLNGVIDGTVGLDASGFPFSFATWTLKSIQVNCGPPITARTGGAIDPLSGAPGIEGLIPLGSNLASLIFERIRQVPAPFLTNQLGGFMYATRVENIVPNRGGNSGLVSPTLTYNAIPPDTEIKLTADGMPAILGNRTQGQNTYSLLTTFDLNNVAPGLRSVVLTPPNSSDIVLPFTFLVEPNGVPDVVVDVVGRNKIQPGQSEIYHIAVSNRGNVDAVGVPVWIDLSNLPPNTTIAPAFVPSLPPAIFGVSLPWDSLPAGIRTENQYLLPVVIPRLPPGVVVDLPVSLRIPADSSVSATLPISVWTNPFYRLVRPQQTAREARDHLRELIQQIYFQTNGQFAADSSLFSASILTKQLQFLVDEAYTNENETGKIFSFTQFIEQAVGKTAQREGSLLDIPRLAQSTGLVFNQLESSKAFHKENIKEKVVEIVSSIDPNTLTGPVSFVGPDGTAWISGLGGSEYTISYENESNATGAAGRVVIRNIFNPNIITPSIVDTTAIRLGTISIDKVRMNPPAVLSTPVFDGAVYRTSIQVPWPNHPGQQVTVRLEVVLGAGYIEWQLTSYDPETDLPTEPGDGFLPPGGQGEITFVLAPLRGLPTPIPFVNGASITFDNNLPVNPPVLRYLLDSAAPTSRVTVLAPTQNAASFLVQWTGADATGCGLKNYRIQVQDNGGQWTDWLSDIPASQTQAVFTGTPGHTYAFRSQAKDNVDNLETEHRQPDTMTQIPSNFRIEGTIVLEGSDDLIQPVTFAFRPDDGSSPFTRTVTLSSTGTYSLDDVPAGQYTVGIKGAKWLRKTLPLDTSASAVANFDATLKAGDTNGDNAADITDLLILIAAYNKQSGQTGFVTNTDFTCNGMVDIMDLLLLIGNFNQFGAP